MNRRLIPCPRCARHVRSAAAECPFCQHALASPATASLAAPLLTGALLLAGCHQPPAPAVQPEPHVGAVNPAPAQPPSSQQGSAIAAPPAPVAQAQPPANPLVNPPAPTVAAQPEAERPLRPMVTRYGLAPWRRNQIMRYGVAPRPGNDPSDL